MSGRTAVLGALCALVMVTAGAGTAAAADPSPDIVISQIYGGGGNTSAPYRNDYVELFNRGTATGSVSGWSVQYASATGTGNFASNPVVALSGSIPPGGYYLVQLAGGANGIPLPTPDATAGSVPNASASAGKLIVANIATGLACNGGSTPCSPAQLAQIVDLIGYGNANFFEGTAAAPTLSNTTAGLRDQGGCEDTDDNAADVTAVAPSPRNSTSPTHLCDVPTGEGSADPSSVARGGSTLLSVTVTGAVTPPSTGITVTADLSSIGGSAAQQFTDAGNNTFTYQATVAPGTGLGSKTLPVTITDEQGRTGAASISLAVIDACGDPKTPISEIQGDGAASDIVGQTRTIEGVVVGSYQVPGEFSGFYVQDTQPDGDPATSEGIFVFSTLRVVAPGDAVRVRGNVTEFGGLTELTSVSTLLDCGEGSVEPTLVSLPVASMAAFERYEGMLVHFSQALTVNETFTLGRFGEVRLAEGGRLYTPTAVTTPGAAAIAQADLNNRRSFVLDDGNNQQNIDPTRYPLGGLTATNTLRSGYTVENLTGVFDDRFSDYRVQPVGPVPFVASNPRTEAPDDVGGNLRIASFNVLNFFNGNGSHQEGAAGGFPTARGANTLFEFDRQLAKEVSALLAIDADVVGLMELENDAPPNSAIEDLVDALNEEAGAGTYAFIDTGVVGTDAIKVALIYKPAKVTPIGTHRVLTSAVDPRFIDTLNRPALAQSFELNENLERFTVAVNHLKSKGSDCNAVGDPDTGDGQGNCNRTRTAAAEALADWLAGDPTGSGSPDAVVIGDLNSYTFEDPITALTDAGYHNLIREHGGLGAYSYVFDGQSGYLDHALSSPTLAAKSAGATDWHINADEPIVLDYNVEFKTAAQVGYFYDPGPYRASDHDPVLAGFELAITFDHLCDATRRFVTSEDVADSLCEKLAAAEEAAARGNERAKEAALNAYIKQLRAQSGKSITKERADFLIGLAETL